ncbi:rRNA adenine N-6-methyltransferase family protein [Exiguobacterium sp. s129]|uniref:class I SAM-dependent methyltransferase n=1 Tax=Exiguobacterium sp. s129 TaxID=2751264 RepID=UPI001BE5008D|nr:rRNA adenine N-6-methyltransferase family protein [Exiguobacterium sp. s129]
MIQSWLNKYMNDLEEAKMISPESTYLAEGMTQKKVLSEAHIIFEIRPGIIGCTEEILRKMRKDATLILIESDIDLVQNLKTRYGRDCRIIIVEADVLDLQNILRALNIEEVDVIFSGLPFSRFNAEQTETILRDATAVLSKTGWFVTFQYTKIRYDHFQQIFSCVGVEREYRNVPPAYLFHCAM